jgi:hypothetical protein
MSGISPQQKTDPKKKEKSEKEQGFKSKRGKTSFEKLHVSKKRKEKKRMRSTSCWQRFYRKRKKGGHIFSIVQNSMCRLIHTHTSFAFALPSIP